MQQQFDKLSLSSTTDTTIMKQLKNVQILENELDVLRDENRMLREANEKLVQKFVVCYLLKFKILSITFKSIKFI